MTELISLLITQVIPLILKEATLLAQRGDFTPEQLAALKAQIASFNDYVNHPEWKPDDA